MTPFKQLSKREETSKQASKQATRICFFHSCSCMGDCILSSFMLREIKKHFPKVHLTVVTPEPSDILYRYNPHIDKLIILSPLQLMSAYQKISLQMRQFLSLFHFSLYTWFHPYDILLTDAGMLTWRNKLFFWTLHTKQQLHLSQQIPWDTHTCHLYGRMLEKIGIAHPDTTYELFIPSVFQQQALDFLSAHHVKQNQYIVLNPLGRVRERTLSVTQIQTIVKTLQQHAPHLPIILLDFRNQYQALAKQAILCPLQDILVVAQLIKHAQRIITVDTSILHMADLFKKPLLAIYCHDKYSCVNNHILVASVQQDTVHVYSHDKIADISLHKLTQTVTRWLLSQ